MTIEFTVSITPETLQEFAAALAKGCTTSEEATQALEETRAKFHQQSQFVEFATKEAHRHNTREQRDS